MWTAIVLVLGMLASLGFILLFRLYKFKGTKLKVRTVYGLALSFFFTLFFLKQSQGNIQIIGKAFILGLVLAVPFCLFSRIWIKNRLRGNKVFYKKKTIWLNLLVGIAVVALMQLLLFQGYGRRLIESIWPILGLTLSWLFCQIFMFFFVVRLERKLGTLILEDVQADSVKKNC